jgi:hypothetical protein
LSTPKLVKHFFPLFLASPEYHRRPAWGGGSWALAGTGMLIASKPIGCKIYLGEFDGEPGDEDECDHINLIKARHIVVGENSPSTIQAALFQCSGGCQF